MLKNLSKKEMVEVAGGWYLNRFECMGEGRNTSIVCLDEKLNEVRGWKIRPNQFFCGVWFCCSGDKQEGPDEYMYLVIGNNQYHCKTGEYKKLGIHQEL